MSAPAATPAVASRVVRVAGPPELVTAYRPLPAAVEHGRGEDAGAQVAQDANLAGELVGDDDVRAAVARDIGQGHVRDAGADRQSHRGQERRWEGR